MQGIFAHSVESVLKEPVPLSQFTGKVCCVVNVASLCSLAPLNMQQLVVLHNKYRNRNFEILAFPCTQFGQEPNLAPQVLQWAETTYGARFPVFNRLTVKGPRQHPLYKLLTQRCGDVTWNYTKFICNDRGEPLRRYDHSMPPLMMESYIGTLLK